MFENLNEPSILVFAISPVLIALNSFFKVMGMPSRFAPLVNLVGGLVAVFPLLQMGLGLLPAIIGGLMVGLSAGGFYDLKRLVE